MRTLSEVIAEWPHDEMFGDMSEGRTHTRSLGTGEYMFDKDCRRCAMERWRDEWAAFYDEPQPPFSFKRDILGVEADREKNN